MSKIALILAAILVLLASSTHAAPLRFIANLHIQVEFPRLPLSGAHLRLDLTWDASPLSPLESDATKTVWPITNTTGSLTVRGSASADGVYAASFPFSPPPTWIMHNGFEEILDAISFPAMRFQKGEQVIESVAFPMRVGHTVFRGQHPYYPKPFGHADLLTSRVAFTTPTHVMEAFLYTGSITEVPEPASSAVGGLALLSLAALRRRK